jgi:hypothetical protein
VRLPQLEPLACIVAFKHIHSGSVPYDPTYPKVTIDNVADARDATMYPAGTRHSFATVAGTGGPISLMYQFVLRSGYNFNFVWHNTTGPLKEGVGSDPGLPSPVVGQRLFDIMGSLPRTDIEFGSVVSLGFTNNGERDVVMYNQALRSQVYVPGHVTDVALPSSSPEWRLCRKLSGLKSGTGSSTLSIICVRSFTRRGIRGGSIQPKLRACRRCAARAKWRGYSAR